MGEWYKLVRTCDCGSDKPFLHWVQDKEGKSLFKVCPACESRKMKSHEDNLQSQKDIKN